MKCNCKMSFFCKILTLFFVLCNNHYNLCKSTVEIFSDQKFKENQPKKGKIYEHSSFCNVVQYEDSLLKYQKMKKAALNNNKPGLYPDQTYFTVEHKNGMYVLDLKLNKNFLSPSYSVTTFSKDGKKETQHVADKEENNCYYQGFVRGSNISKVLVSTCNGLRGVIMIDDDIMSIFRLDNGTHYISKSDPNDDALNFCETSDDFQRSVRDNNFGFQFQNQISSQSRTRKRIFVELMIVADNEVYNTIGSVQSVESFIKGMVNIVNAFYLELDIRVVLKHIEIWNQGNLLPSNTNSSEMLEQFAVYRVNRFRMEEASSPWATADSIHLLFGNDFDGPTLGVAYLGSICRVTSVGLTQTGSVFSSAAILTHELGHVLGMRHTNNRCTCPVDKDCIMKATTSGSTALAWSDCSRAVIENARLYGIPSCILNEPNPDKNLAGPLCGNDIIEEGEECDCGTAKTCTSRCCNPAICKFLLHAVCDKELCCDDCRVAIEGFECREADDECEVTEYCDGSSTKCPVNSFKANGVMCSNGHGTCQNGVCYTHDSLCKRIWGSDGSNADNLCYRNLNPSGNLHGNCGVDGNGIYKKCSSENIFCGKLHCVGGNMQPAFGTQSYRLTFSNGIECKEVGDDNRRIIQQTLVQDGTGCGPNKVCMNAECVQYTPVLCSAQCNGNGVCDNFGRCVCIEGYLPPDCLQLDPSKHFFRSNIFLGIVSAISFISIIGLYVIAKKCKRSKTEDAVSDYSILAEDYYARSNIAKTKR